jgi:hypothetical protein
MSSEPNQPTSPPSPTRQEPVQQAGPQTRVGPPAADSSATRVDPPAADSSATRLDLRTADSSATPLEPPTPDSSATRIDPPWEDSAPTRLDPSIPQSPATRLDPQRQDAPPTRQDPQPQRAQQPQQDPRPPQSPQWQPNQAYQQAPPNPQWQQEPRRQQGQAGYQAGGYQDRGYQGSGYQGGGGAYQGGGPQGAAYQNPGYQKPGYQDPYQDTPPAPPRRKRHRIRRSFIALFIIIVLAILLVIANFVGKAVAENDMADQFTANGFPVKPSVDIEGFPFLTQVVQKDFKKVVITASNIPAGPVTISSLKATLTGMHLNKSWNGATIDQLTATAFISLNSLTGGISSALGDAASLTGVPDGPDKLKVTGTVLGASASGVVVIKQTGPQQITVELPTAGGLVGSLIGSAASFTINLPAGVPPSLRITGLALDGNGLTLSAGATDATFSK